MEYLKARKISPIDNTGKLIDIFHLSSLEMIEKYHVSLEELISSYENEKTKNKGLN